MVGIAVTPAGRASHRVSDDAVTRDPVTPDLLTEDPLLRLVLDDEDLLRAEFEAIVEAVWGPAPPAAATPVPGPRPGPGGRYASSRAGTDPQSARSGRPAPGHDGWSRERSPPA